MKLLYSRNTAYVLGIALITMQVMAFTQANVTGRGSMVTNIKGIEQSLHAAAPVAEHVGIQLLIGLLLILLGFLLHTLMITRSGNGERPVHVTGVPGAKRMKRIPQPQWFWVEMEFDKQ